LKRLMCLLGLILIIVSFSSTAIYAQNFQPADPGSGVGDNPNTAVLPTSGSPWVWGDNTYNQLGSVAIDNSSAAIEFLDPVAPMTGVTAISAGQRFNLAVKSDGTVWGWGFNPLGELGHGTITNTSATSVQVLDPTDPTGKLTGVTSIASSDDHSLALKSDGTVRGWGYNGAGELGNGTTNDSAVALEVLDPADPTGNFTGVTAIATGWYHSLLLKSNGTVWNMGWNANGQLGNGTTTDSAIPVQVSGLTNIIAIAGGGFHSIALKSDGTVWDWGWNAGQLGNGTYIPSYVPVQATGLTNVIAITGGYEHSMALKSDGSVWAWGSNDNGELGTGDFIPHNIPVQVTGLSGVTAIAANFEHSLALKSDGTVWAWGLNEDGQLGNGGNANSNIPVQVTRSGGVPFGSVTAIASGGEHSIAIVSSNLAITTASLPNGAPGVAYTPTTLTATGGTGTYTWSIQGTPNLSTTGLSLSAGGVITGANPSAFGPSNITFSVNDGVNTATKQLSLTISATVPTISSFTPATGSTGTSVTIHGTGFTGANAVTFGGIAAAPGFTVNTTDTNDNIITAVVAGGGTGHVSVSNPFGTATSATNFIYIDNRIATITTINSSPNPSTNGQTITFTANVSYTGGGALPTGSVTFMVTVNSLDTPIASPIILSGSTQAVLQTSSLTLGTHTIKAVYSGDNNYLNSSSSVINQMVNSGYTGGGGGGGGGATPSADLSISVNSSSPVKVGSAITYTINVINAGPSTATSVTVTDILPAGVTFVSASGDAWNFSQQATTLSFTRASLPVGSAPAITVNVTATAAGTISNSATVVASQSDSNSTNNTATTSTTVTAATPTATPTATSTPTSTPTTTQTPSPTPSATTSPVPTTTTSTPTSTAPAGTTTPSSTPGETGSGIQPWVIVIIVVVAIAIVLAIVLMIMRRRREV
jgi:uncharacterized repeat protein (TIGR01451 family)